MFDGFNAWSRMIAAGWSMAQTGLRVAETMGAANEVVKARSALIGSAVRSPMESDHRELARMVPEKVEAFSDAGAATVKAWWAAQSAWTTEMQHLGAMAARGRLPTMGELAELGGRMTSFGLASVEGAARLGASSIAPVHRTATSNASRLKRKGKRLRR